MKALTTLFAVLFLAGCATPLQQNQTRITFSSNPPGATISSGSELRGVAPFAIIWTLDKFHNNVSGPITATWVSGATVFVTMRLTAGQEGSYTINRPAGVAGLEQDVQWAIHIEQQKSARDAANGAALAASLQSFSNGLQTYKAPTSVNCSSYNIGNTVQTNCY